jgi:hypothetical protein
MNVLKSKTINFAAILAVLGVVEANFQVLQPFLGEHYGTLLVVIGAITAGLRVVTTQPLKEK